MQLAGESPCYLAWCAKHTAVYPGFVRIITPAYLLPVQLALFAAAITWFGWLLDRRSGLLVASLVVLGLVANPYVWQLQGSIMSEALTMPLLIVVIGCSLLWLDGRRPAYLMVAFVASSLTATARPSGLLTILIPLASLWLGQRAADARPSKLVLSGLGMLCWLLPVVAERTTTHFVLGAEQTSLAGRHMMAKAGVIDAPPVNRKGFSPLENRVADMMELQFAPIRDTFRPLSGPVKDLVRFNYEVCIAFSCTDEAMKDVHVRRPELDAALVRVGFARLKQNPLAYLDLAWAEYRGLWSLHTRKHPDIAPAYNAFLAKAMPLPFQTGLGVQGVIVPLNDQKSYYRYDRMVMFAIAWACILLLIALLISWFRGERGPSVVAPLATLIGLEAILVFIALLGVGIPRYPLGLWPAIVIGLVLGALHYLRRSHFSAVKRKAVD